MNEPFEVAEKIYETIKVGTPVIAFYREEVELTAENAKISNAFSYKDPEKKKQEDRQQSPEVQDGQQGSQDGTEKPE